MSGEVATEATRLFTALINDGDVKKISNLKQEWFNLGTEIDTYNFITDHIRQYGSMPSRDSLLRENHLILGDGEATDSIEYYTQNLISRSIFNESRNIEQRLQQAIINSDTGSVTAILQQSLRTINGFSFDGNDTPSIKEIGNDVLLRLKRNQTSINQGVMTGYTPIDDDLMGLKPGEMLILSGRPKRGKSISNKEPVLKKDGTWCKMGDIKVGDSLASIDGKESTVLGVYPQGEKDLYEVELWDNRKVKASLDHLWEVHYRFWSDARVLTTKTLIEMLDKKRYQGRLWVDTVSGDFGEEKDLPVDPWLLGFLVGDGCFRLKSNISFSNSERDNFKKVEQKLPSECSVSYHKAEYKNKNYLSGNILKSSKTLIPALKELGLFNKKSIDKFIPDIYLSASRNQRRELLRGLMDSDGSVENSAKLTIQFSNKKLINDTIKVVRSLGGICKRQERITLSGRKAYRIIIRHEDTRQFISSKKHLERFNKFSKGRYKKPRLTIKSIKKVGKGDATCIAVSHPRKLFITRDYIATHNTYYLLNMVINAWVQGNSVMFVSMEMSPEAIVNRIIAIKAGLNPRAMRSRISTHAYTNASETLRGFDDMPDFHFVGGNFRKTPQDIARYASNLEPELLGVDGAYLLSPNDRTRYSAKHEVLGEVINDRKAMNEDLGIPSIDTVQFNRQASGQRNNKGKQSNDVMGSEFLGGSDAYLQTATAAVGVGKISGRDNVRRLKMMDSRDGESSADMICNFEFSPPNYDYLCDYVEEEQNSDGHELDTETQQALI